MNQDGITNLGSKTKMEAFLKEQLDLKVLKSVETQSGCISAGKVYETDKGKIFVKVNTGSEANVMFQGEYESLNKIFETKIISVPKPILVGKIQNKSFIAMDYLNFNGLNKYSSQLGKSLAELHLHNIKALKKKEKSENLVGSQYEAIEKFGFHIPTACGYILQNNEWSSDWVSFYATQKLNHQINLILKKKGSREINELWSQLQLKIPLFFKNIEIEPSLLHGDLWCGNVGETESEPVIFDPASFYGHHEYDLAIAVMFGGFDKTFFDSYHSIIKKTEGFNKRQELYLLFHHLNHWNHFNSHKNSSLQIMRNLIST